MAPTFLSPEALLQLQNFAEIAFLNLRTSVTLPNQTLNNSLQFKHFVHVDFIGQIALIFADMFLLVSMCLSSSLNDPVFQKKKKKNRTESKNCKTVYEQHSG